MNRLESAQGYLELGMNQEALDVLDSLPSEEASLSASISLRLMALNGMERWEMAADLARQSIPDHPHCGALYLLGAYAIRRLLNVSDARHFLESGKAHLETDPLYHFNMACYDCVLGDEEAAREKLAIAFELAPRMRELAMTDPDLESIRESLRPPEPDS